MSKPLHEPDEQERRHARNEAEAAVHDVLVDVERRRAHEALVEAARRVRRVPRLQMLLLLALIALQAYLWLAHPVWLRVDPPAAPTYRYYVDGWRMAIAMQRERIEGYRLHHGKLPPTIEQAGRPIPGVNYDVQDSLAYKLAAGEGRARITWSSRDSVDFLLGESVRRLHLFESGAPR